MCFVFLSTFQTVDTSIKNTVSNTISKHFYEKMPTRKKTISPLHQDHPKNTMSSLEQCFDWKPEVKARENKEFSGARRSSKRKREEKERHRGSAKRTTTSYNAKCISKPRGRERTNRQLCKSPSTSHQNFELSIRAASRDRDRSLGKAVGRM